jgi:hypothetical protein
LARALDVPGLRALVAGREGRERLALLALRAGLLVLAARDGAAGSLRGLRTTRTFEAVPRTAAVLTVARPALPLDLDLALALLVPELTDRKRPERVLATCGLRSVMGVPLACQRPSSGPGHFKSAPSA